MSPDGVVAVTDPTRAVVVVRETEAPAGGVQIAGVLDAGEVPPPGTPAGTIFLVRQS